MKVKAHKNRDCTGGMIPFFPGVVDVFFPGPTLFLGGVIFNFHDLPPVAGYSESHPGIVVDESET